MLFNTHTHINDASITNIDLLLENAKKNQVSYLCVVGTTIQDSFRAVELANLYNHLYAICGIHPSELDDFANDFSTLEVLCQNKKTVAIGEIGLDYHYPDTNKQQQLYYFEKFLQQACLYQKPVVIHMRDAYEDTYHLLAKYATKLDGIILHCYSGSVEMMQRFLKLGCYISISGVVTFKNARHIIDVVQQVPLQRLLIETDDPYMSPVPFRGQQNQPAYVYYVAKKIAEIRNCSLEEIAEITTENAKRVFHI